MCSWSKLADLNVARYDFACAQVNGTIYVVGGYGRDGNSFPGAEVYNPKTNSWSLISCLRHPRWGCFACGLEGKLYVMGGRSSFTIGNSKFVDPFWCWWKMVQVPLTGSMNIRFRFGILEGKLLLFSLQEEAGYQTLLYDPKEASGSEWQTSQTKPFGSCLCCICIFYNCLFVVL
ncbi:hypothetical protein UlMin_044336 [Ulmus minor]